VASAASRIVRADTTEEGFARAYFALTEPGEPSQPQPTVTHGPAGAWWTAAGAFHVKQRVRRCHKSLSAAGAGPHCRPAARGLVDGRRGVSRETTGPSLRGCSRGQSTDSFAVPEQSTARWRITLDSMPLILSSPGRRPPGRRGRLRAVCSGLPPGLYSPGHSATRPFPGRSASTSTSR
jgi:hypothetical protein